MYALQGRALHVRNDMAYFNNGRPKGAPTNCNHIILYNFKTYNPPYKHKFISVPFSEKTEKITVPFSIPPNITKTLQKHYKNIKILKKVQKKYKLCMLYDII